jgi:transcriptional regulator with PAS, ATPase and Fis domain
VPVNCAAFPDALLESELFGYLKGSFSGATSNKVGLVEAAHNGTLFLDEVSESSPQVQAKLLRFLEDREYRPLGSVECRHADARIISATNRDLEKLVRNGAFREDLYYRLRVVVLELPALRERMEDLPTLVDSFLKEFARTYSRSAERVTAQALKALSDHTWPGNVRELRNCIESMVVLSSGPELDLSSIPPYVTNPGRFELSNLGNSDLLAKGSHIENWGTLQKSVRISNNLGGARYPNGRRKLQSLMRKP